MVIYLEEDKKFCDDKEELELSDTYKSDNSSDNQNDEEDAIKILSKKSGKSVDDLLNMDLSEFMKIVDKFS